MHANGITYLKVKIKSLAAEARIIRLEERRARTRELRDGLAEHRRTTVRRQARSTQLAYGFLRGRPLSRLEPHTRKDRAPDWKSVRQMVDRYGVGNAGAGLEEWRA